MHKPTAAVRVAAFFAAVSVTTVMVASQFGLAHHYVDAAGLLWAGQADRAPVALDAPPAASDAG